MNEDITPWHVPCIQAMHGRKVMSITLADDTHMEE
jgi:hypothetical protein